MMMQIITPPVDYNLLLKRLTNQSKLTKVLKVVKPTNKKTLLKTLGTSVINSPLSPLYLIALLEYSRSELSRRISNAQKLTFKKTIITDNQIR